MLLAYYHRTQHGMHRRDIQYSSLPTNPATNTPPPIPPTPSKHPSSFPFPSAAQNLSNHQQPQPTPGRKSRHARERQTLVSNPCPAMRATDGRTDGRTEMRRRPGVMPWMPVTEMGVKLREGRGSAALGHGCVRGSAADDSMGLSRAADPCKRCACCLYRRTAGCLVMAGGGGLHRYGVAVGRQVYYEYFIPSS